MSIHEDHQKDVRRRVESWLRTPHQRLVSVYWRTHGRLPDGPLPGCGCEDCTGLPARPALPHPRRERLDVERARSASILDVVRRLGLGEPKRVGREWRVRCPLHEDRRPSLGIDASGGLWFCHPCGLGGDTIKLVMAVRRCGFADAVRWLTGGDAGSAAMFGIAAASHSYGTRRTTLTTETTKAAPPPDPLELLRSEGMVVAAPATIYTAVSDELPLTPNGARYLAGRALDPDACFAFGLRSIDGPRGWRALAGFLSANWTSDERRVAGLGRLPWRGMAPAIALPYRRDGEVVALRFRATASARPKYLQLTGVPIAIPFNASALDGCAGDELHVCEGEFDALTLHLRGTRAVGLPGTGTPAALLDTLARSVADVRRLVVWRDADDAGAGLAGRICASLELMYGADWLRARVVIRRPLAAKDVNELAALGRLEDGECIYDRAGRERPEVESGADPLW